MKKLLDAKWKEFKVKSINKEHRKLTKYLCHVLAIKDKRICTLAYFHKDSVKSCKEIEKGCDKKNSDNRRRL